MRQEDFNYSDEILNAYLDNELAGEERKQLIEALRNNDGLRQRVCRLEQVRNMVSIAYHDIPKPRHTIAANKRRLSSFATIAASVLVVIGIIGGWFGHAQLQGEKGLVQLADSIQINNPVSDAQPWKVLLHVTTDDDYRLNVLLDETERVLQEFKAKQQKVSIQILANGKGLNLLRGDKSAYGKRISELQSNYENLVFTACAKAMARVKLNTGKDVTLLPDTKVAPSALSEVLNKQKEGWTYLKI